jgi:hypothetical protein
VFPGRLRFSDRWRTQPFCAWIAVDMRRLRQGCHFPTAASRPAPRGAVTTALAPIRRAGDRYFQRRRQTPPRPSARPTTMFFARRPACPVRTGSPGRREPRCPVKLARETAFPCHAASPLCRVRRLEHPVHCGGSGTSAPLAAGNYGAAAGPGRHRPCRRRLAVLRRGHRRRPVVPRLEAPAGDRDGLHLIGTGHARPIASGNASTVDSWGHWKSRSAESSAATSLRA